MVAIDRPFQLVYVSELTPGTAANVVDEIANVSRQRNLSAGISGALLFDGVRFAQLLEGSEQEVRPLMTRIQDDQRHCNVSISGAGHFGLPRLTTHWRLAFCSLRAIDTLSATPLTTNEVALALFMSALAYSRESRV